MLSGKPKLKDKLINRNLNESEDDQFIFFTNRKENKLLQQIEIQAVFNSNSSRKVMVIIDKKSTIDYLCMKIAEQMEKFEEFANLDGLKAGNLTKKTEKGQITKIPSSCELKEHINDGDTINFDLTTYEYWIKTNIQIISTYTQLTISLDIKFKLESLFKTLKFLLIKLGINFWSDYPKGLDESFHYTFTNAKFKTTKSKHNFEFNINDLNKTGHTESMKIKEIFDFNSEITCTINLLSIEEILQKELRNCQIDAPTNNKLRWNEFKDLTFDAFYNDRKFQPEKQYIRRLIKKNLASNSERTQNSFYLYNRNLKSKTPNALEDDDALTRNEIIEEKANLIILPQNNSFIIRGKDELKKSMLSNSKLNDSYFLDKNKRKNTTSKVDAHREQSEQMEEKARCHRSFLGETPKFLNFNDSENSSENDGTSKFGIMEFYKDAMDINRNSKNTKEKKNNISSGNVSVPNYLLKKEEGEIILDSYGNKELFNEFLYTDGKKETNDDVVTVVESKNESELIEERKFISEKRTGFFSHYRDTSIYSNLVNIFRSYFKGYKFVEIIENYSNLKIPKNTLERVTMPQFRDVKIQSELKESEIVNQTGTKIDEEEPLSVNNKKILLFIAILVFIFICTILVIFIFC